MKKFNAIVISTTEKSICVKNFASAIRYVIGDIKSVKKGDIITVKGNPFICKNRLYIKGIAKVI